MEPKKQPTEKQLEARRKFAEAAKARAEAKREAKQEPINPEQAMNVAAPEEDAPQEPVVPETRPDGEPQITISQMELDSILRYVKELEAKNWRESQGAPAQAPQGAQTAGGRLVGTVERYSMDKDKYADPRPRLFEEARLQRFAFSQNYELNFEITSSEYTTIDNVRMREPKFTLELVRVMFDEETGEPTDGRYIICRVILHEDPEAALAIAREQGIAVDDTDEVTFLNEMRYLRMRDWLLECFYPAPVKTVKNKKDMVIDGRLVEYYEVNSESDEVMPFSRLDKKKMVR